MNLTAYLLGDVRLVDHLGRTWTSLDHGLPNTHRIEWGDAPGIFAVHQRLDWMLHPGADAQTRIDNRDIIRQRDFYTLPALRIAGGIIVALRDRIILTETIYDTPTGISLGPDILKDTR